VVKQALIFSISLTSSSLFAASFGEPAGHESFRELKFALSESEYIAAPVINVTPVTRRVGIPQTQIVCSNDTVPVYSSANTSKPADILAGAIIGSIIGNNLKGEQNGGTAGAVIGGLVAHASTKRSEVVRYQDVERCKRETIYVYEDRIAGYEVTYEIDGEHRTTRMQYDPGSFLQIRRTISYQIN